MITFTDLLKRTKTERIVIHTPTEEQAITLLKALDEKGYMWADGEKLTTKALYEIHDKDTCYNFEPNNKIMYSPLDYYQQEYYAIVECNDIDFKENV